MRLRRPALYFAPTVLLLTVYFLSRGAAPDPPAEERLWRHRNLGKALFEGSTSVADSVKELKQALDLAPDSARDRLNYGLALLRSGNTKEAIAELEKVQHQDPSLPHTWFNLGIAYKRETRYEDAIRQFHRMAELDPSEPVSRYNLGMLYRLMEKGDLALEQFEMAAKLDPKLVAPRFQIYNHYRLQGKEKEAAEALAAFQKVREAQQAADDSEDMEWSAWAELYDPAAVQPVAAAAGPTPELTFAAQTLMRTRQPSQAGLRVLDAEGDSRPDLLVWSPEGIRLFESGADELAQPEMAGLKGVVSAASGDYDNDGLADLCVLTDGTSSIYRNVKGKFTRLSVKLPAGRFEAAAWLDFDHDYDSDLFLFGAKSVLLRNEGDGRFGDYSAQFPFVEGQALDAVALRSVSDTKGIDLVVSYRDRAGMLYRDDLRGVFRAAPLKALPKGANSLNAADIDNDGWFDLAFATEGGISIARNRQGAFEPGAVPGAGSGAFVLADLENRGRLDLVARDQALRNLGQTTFAPGTTPAGLREAADLAEADFDADGRTDLAAVQSDGAVVVLRNQTKTANRWIAVGLTGVKVARLAPGAEVEVKAGAYYQKKVHRGWPLLFGLGTATDVDTVRISWPNGLIQNQTKEAAGRTVSYKEAPKLAGSCPMVFAWNGREFQFLGDILGVAPLGASSGDGNYFAVDHDEYLQIPAESLRPRGGRYEIRITEELREVTYLDQVRLIAVDHPERLEIYTSEKFKSPPFADFRLYGVERRQYPLHASDGTGRNVLERLIRRDRRYIDVPRPDLSGVAGMHTLDLDFGKSAAERNQAILVLNGWTDWADGSVFLNASQRPGGGLILPYLQVKDADGRWRTVVEDMGIPSGSSRSIAVDLTGKFLSRSREVRIVTNMCIYWDQVFLSDDARAPEARLSHMEAASADLLLRGFSQPVIYHNHEQPEEYIYSRWKPFTSWNQAPGLYTRYGPVAELVRSVDDTLLVMGSGDELRLSFDARSLGPVPPGWRRDFLLLVDGWSKDGDANTAFANSVEPLPFHGMSSYPYPDAERYPDGADHREYRRRYNTRPAVQFIWSMAAAR